MPNRLIATHLIDESSSLILSDQHSTKFYQTNTSAHQSVRISTWEVARRTSILLLPLIIFTRLSVCACIRLSIRICTVEVELLPVNRRIPCVTCASVRHTYPTFNVRRASHYIHQYIRGEYSISSGLILNHKSNCDNWMVSHIRDITTYCITRSGLFKLKNIIRIDGHHQVVLIIRSIRMIVLTRNSRNNKI